MNCKTQTPAENQKVEFLNKNSENKGMYNPKLRLWLQINDYEQTKEISQFLTNLYDSSKVN